MLRDNAVALGRLFLFQNHHPAYLIFFVTNRCEAHCSHCFYWRQKNSPTNELTLPQIEDFAAKCGPLVQLTLTGGSPELRDDLPEIASIFWRRCRPVNITLCSNGGDPEKLRHDVAMIYERHPECRLTVDISVDGLHEEHDRLRGVKGLFQKVLHSYRLLSEVRAHHPALRLGCGLTVSGLNKHTAYATACWAMEHLPIDNFTPILVRGEPRARAALETDSGVFLKIADEVEKRLTAGSFKGYASFSGIINRKDIIQKKLIHRIYTSGESPIRCSAARETAVVYPDGTVGLCELRQEELGFLPDVGMDIAALWQSARTKQLRKQIATEGCRCWHQCFLSPTIVKSPRLWLSRM